MRLPCNRSDYRRTALKDWDSFILDIRKRLILVATLFLSIPLLFGCFIDVKRVVETASDNKAQLPIRRLRITIDENQLNELVSQLRQFADKHNDEFEFLGSDLKTVGSMVELLGDHIKIIAADSPYNPTLIEIDFYDQTRAKPVSEETLQTMDDLVNDLKGYINEIPNVTITEKVKSLVITIDANRDDEVYNQLRKFADSHSLEFTLSFSSDKSLFHLEIYGEGFHINGEDRLRSKGVDDINIILYTDTSNEFENPTPISQETIDELFSDLKRYINEIPNIVVEEGE